MKPKERDRVQLTAPNRELGVANRDLGTIQKIDEGGNMTLRMDGDREKTITLDPREMRHFDHGYAVTSHSSQGLTSERVLVNMDTDVHPELISRRFAYESVSRASHDAQLFTNDATTLATTLIPPSFRPPLAGCAAETIPFLRFPLSVCFDEPVTPHWR